MVDVRAETWVPTVCESAPDDVLARRAGTDDEAFAELYRRYVDGIYRYMRYQAPEEEAKDLTAQVFFHAYRASDQFRGDSSYRSWLFRIGHNTLVSFRRKRLATPLPVEAIPEPEDGSDDRPDRPGAELRRTLWSIVGELSPHERELVELRFVEDLSPKEIARVTGHTPGAVRVRLHRLLGRLRRRLEERGVGR